MPDNRISLRLRAWNTVHDLAAWLTDQADAFFHWSKRKRDQYQETD